MKKRLIWVEGHDFTGLVLLPLHLGHHGTASRKHRGRARLQLPRPRHLREAHLRRNWTR